VITLLLGLCLALGVGEGDDALPSPVTEEPAPAAAASAEAPPEEMAPADTNSLQGQPGIRKLDRKTRAKVMSAMAGFVILWAAIIVFIWLGARYTRRYMHGTLRSPSSRSPAEEDDWARKKLVPEPEEDA
jgi:hypothetical protein